MRNHIRFSEILLFCLLLLCVMILCLCLGSVSIPLSDIFSILRDKLLGQTPAGTFASILLSVRLPRILCVSLCGAALSLSGAAMQGLLKNPLADGSTLGVSSGASLGAVIAMAANLSIPGIPYGGTMITAMLFAFLSLLLILSLAYVLDRSLATHSIILIGVIFSMFSSSLMSLIIPFAGEKIRSITFWTMGSLAGSNMTYAGLMALALLLCSPVLLSRAEELNAFAVSEENARNIGVNIRKTRLEVLISVSILIGVCVSIGGTISFVGLVTPHITRMIIGPNHRRLLPASLFSGAVFLLLADLISRTLLSPIELPIGVVTSLVGAVLFILIFYQTRKGSSAC
ncbi:MAG: iron ABC transporter permease [Lachnospiraceae bacterium]|nr:iron ABC transporter permease [Lachnospiraceae bacterium]